MCTLTTLTQPRHARQHMRRLLFFSLLAFIGLTAFLLSPSLRPARSAKSAAFFATRLVSTAGADAGDCTGAPCLTINYAIGQAVAGDTVNVAAGTYNENVVLNKNLILQGAQAGVNACGRVASETIITAAAGILLNLQTPAGGTIINGFTFSGGARGIESTSGTLDNLQLLNNRVIGFTGNGVFLNNNGVDVTVNQNSIDGGSKTGSGGLFHLDQDSFLGFQFTNNCITGKGATDTSTGFFVDGNHNVGVSATPRTPLISGNTITNCQTGMNLGRFAFAGTAATNNGTISNNTFSNNLFDGLQGGIQNTTIINNVFSNNGRHGLALTGFSTSVSGDNTRGAQNTMVISNLMIGNGFVNTGAGISFNAFQFPGTISTNQAHCNRIVNNNQGAVYNGTETINLENNWWGCNYGPGMGGAGCAGAANALAGTGAANLDANPWLVMSFTAVPPAAGIGGTSILTTTLTTNSNNAAAPCTVPDGTPVTYAGTLGTVMPTNTATTAGMAMSTFTATTTGVGGATTTVDGQTLAASIVVPGFRVSISDPIVCTGDNITLSVRAELVNPNNNQAGFLFTAPVLPPLTPIAGTCISSVGTCAINNNTVTATGTIPAMQSVVIEYKVRVINNPGPGTNLCITSTGRLDVNNDQVFDTTDTITACTQLNCPPNVPVNARVSDQKAGSVLVFPYYTSNALQQKDTRLTISNISNAASTVANQTYVHIFFIDGATCRQSDLFLCLTPNASAAFKALEYDPEATGWVLAVAVDVQGRPIQNNVLIGNAFVRDGDYVDNYAAETFWAYSRAVAALGATSATLFFDGASYDAVPGQFAVEIQSPADAGGQRIVTAGLSGDLTTSQITGAAQVGTGQAFNEKEAASSFNNWLTGTCQAQATISLLSPRVPNGLGNLIRTGQAGYLKFNVGAAVGLIMTPRTAAWRGIRALHKTALTTSTILIPIFAPVC